jgi:sulfur carrier protein
LKLIINGQNRESRSEILSDLLQELDISSPHYAVALNHQVIPKSQYPSTPLNDGDQVEIVHAVGGGV